MTPSRLISLLAVLALCAPSLRAHPGSHPTGLPECDDALLAIHDFELYGEGVIGSSEQPLFEPQFYQLVNTAEPGRIPRCLVGFGFSLYQGHPSNYRDYTLRVDLPTGTLEYTDGFPSQWLIVPLIHGWSGSMTVTLSNNTCDIAMKAIATWNFPRPAWLKNPCAPCEDLTCRSSAEIGSVELSIPAGVVQHGLEPVTLLYDSEELANQGVAKLELQAPRQFGPVVQKDGKIVTSVECGDHLTRITNEPTPADPNRFVVRQNSDKTDPDNTVFRETCVENVTLPDGETALRCTETTAGKTTVREYTQPDPGSWVLNDQGLRRTTRSVLSETPTARITRRHVEEKNPAGAWVTVALREEHETKYDWGWTLTKRIVDPDGQALTTEWDYYEDSEFSGPNDDTRGRGLLQRESLPTGLTRTFEYLDSDPFNSGFDQLTIEREAFAGEPLARERRIHLAATNSTLDELRETWIAGDLIEKTEIRAQFSGAGSWREELHYPSAGGPPLLTRREFGNSSSFQKTIYPDGTIEQFQSQYADGLRTVTVHRGVPNPRVGPPIITGRETRTVINQVGQVVHTEISEIQDGTVFPIESRLATEFDSLARPIAFDVFHGGNPVATYNESRQFGCCGLESRTGQDQLSVTFYYDDLARLRKVHRNGLSSETIYDGLTLRNHLYPETEPTSLSFANAQNETGFATRNLAGDVVATAARAPHDGSLVTTTYATTYDLGDGVGRRVVESLPLTPDDQGSAPTIAEDYYLDGRLKQRTGAPVVDQLVTYGSNPDGLTTTVALLDANSAPRQAVTTQLDWMGRALKTTYRGDADGDLNPDQEHFEYDSAGRLSKQVDADGVTILFAYDPETQTNRRALDLNQNGLIDPDHDEVRITRAGVSLNDDGEVVTWTEDAVRDLDDSGTGFERILSRRETTADLLQEWTLLYAGGQSSTTHTSTSYPADQPGTRLLTTVHPDGTSLLRQFRTGLLDSESLHAADATLLISRHYSYDQYRRLIQISDSSAPTRQRSYPAPFTAAPASITIGSRTTRYEYDARGRRTVIDEPDSVDQTGAPVDNRQTFSYWPHDRVREVIGTPGYRRSFTYDFAQRLETLTTYGTNSATTRWEYDLARGWLTAKRYDSPAPGIGSGETFSYSPGSRLAQRVNARGIATTYQYGPGGRLSSTTYDDGTPAVRIDQRDRLGRIAQITDASGPRQLRHSDHDQPTESIYQPGSILAGWSVAQARDSQDRLHSLSLQHDGTAHHQLDYAYDTAGRAASVSAHGLVAHYEYDPARQLVAQLSIVNGQRPLHFATRQYDELNRLQRITWHNGNLQGSFVAHADYLYQRDPFGRVTRATQRDGTQWRYAFNAAGELASARRHLTDTSPDLLAGHSFSWSYDGIGNRTSAARGGDANGSHLRTTTYTSNSLNQFTTVQSPGFASVNGAAPLAPEILVNGEPAARQGPFFHHELASDNSAGPVWQAVSVTQGSASDAGSILVPPATTAPQYDPDGNLTSDGIYQFRWDAENRLVEIESLSAAVAAGLPYQRVELTYDSFSRRVQRLLFDQPANAPPVESTRYLYAGWRCLGEIDGAGNLQRTYAWGLDHQDRLHLGDSNAALLWIHDHPSNQTHLATYDGQGNLTGLVSAQTDQPTASYTYSPFGQLLTSSGPYADRNPYRFSTKPFEPVGALYNYGYRHYSPRTGSWLSRDPIAEDGGLNLYGFVGNAPIGTWDRLGLNSFNDTGQRNRVFDFVGDAFNIAIGNPIRESGQLGSAVQRQMRDNGHNPLVSGFAGAAAAVHNLTGLLNVAELGVGGEFSVGPNGELQFNEFDNLGDELGHAGEGLAATLGTLLAGSGTQTLWCRNLSRRAPGGGNPPNPRALDDIRDSSSAGSDHTNRVVGRTPHLETPGVIRPGEKTLDFHLFRRPDGEIDARPTWYANHRALRRAMAEGRPIRDVSPGSKKGRFLNGERLQLEHRGWTKVRINGDLWWTPPA